MSQQRWEELKAKGFVNLVGNERKEYSTLKQVFGETEPTTQSEEVTVSKASLEGLLSRVQQLEEERRVQAMGISQPGDWEEVGEVVEPVRDATLRTLEGSYLIDWKFARRQFNTDTREMDQWFNIKLIDDNLAETEQQITLSDFAKLDRSMVKILSSEKKHIQRKVGVTRAKIVDYERWQTRVGKEVPLIIRGLVMTCEVQLPGGKIIKLNADRLNQ